MRLIDADKLKQHYAWWKDGGARSEDAMIFDQIVDMQPTVEVRNKGKWIDLGWVDEEYGERMGCPFCGKETFGGNFCSKCGADMRGEEIE